MLDILGILWYDTTINIRAKRGFCCVTATAKIRETLSRVSFSSACLKKRRSASGGAEGAV